MRHTRRLFLPIVMGVFSFMLATTAMAAPAEWQRVDVTLHAEQTGGMLLISGELPGKASLPADAELAVPEGSEVNWIGQILGGEPSADPELQYQKSTESGVDVYRFTLTKSRIAQVEVPITDQTAFDGTNYNAALAWTSSQNVPEVKMSVKIPVGSKIVQQAADASIEPADEGYSYYSKTVKNVKAGQPVDLSFAYSAAAPAAPAAAATAPAAAPPQSTALVFLMLLVIAGAAAILVIGIRRKAAARATDTPSAKKLSPSVAIVLLVAVVFGGVLIAKAVSGSSAPTAAAVADASTGAPAPAGGTTITSTHNDAVADYEAALKTGKPIYLLFHSLTCDPCVEISAVVDKVMPGYEGKVVFVNAISDDPSAQQLASKFQFQYIPTSFFITPDGKVFDSFTGAMPDTDMRARLDKLIAQ